MESKFKKIVNENKGFVVFYLIWFLLHLIFLSVGGNYVDAPIRFWPFEGSHLDYYDFSEFALYIIAPVVILGIWKLIGKDIKEKMNDIVNKLS